MHFPAEHADSQSPPSIGGTEEPMGQVVPLDINSTYTDRIFVENNFLDLLYGRVDCRLCSQTACLFGVLTGMAACLDCGREGCDTSAATKE